MTTDLPPQRCQYQRRRPQHENGAQRHPAVEAIRDLANHKPAQHTAKVQRRRAKHRQVGRQAGQFQQARGPVGQEVEAHQNDELGYPGQDRHARQTALEGHGDRALGAGASAIADQIDPVRGSLSGAICARILRRLA